MSHSKDRPATAAKRPISSTRLYVFLLLLFGILSVIEYLLGRLPLTEALVALGDYEKAQLDILKERNQLLTTLATAVVGATAGLILKREKPTQIEKPETRRIMASVVLAAISIYFGHVGSSQVMFMLHHNFFNVYYPGIWLVSQLQFVAFLCSAIILADTAYRMVMRTDEVS